MPNEPLTLHTLQEAFGPDFISEDQLERLRRGSEDPVLILRAALKRMRLTDRLKIWRPILGKWVLYPHPCGLKIWVRLGDTMATGILKSQHDDRATKFFLSRLTPEGTFVDIGANHGWFTLRIAQAYSGGSGRVIAFEPQRELCGYLRKSLRENGLDGVVTLHEFALGNDNRKIALTASTLNSGGTQVVLGPQEGLELSEMRRLDDVVPKGEKIDCVKIDIEGAELLWLEGAQNFIEQHRPIIYSEVHHRKLQSLSKVTALEYIRIMESRGYRTYALDRMGDAVPFGQYEAVNDPTRLFNLVFQPD